MSDQSENDIQNQGETAFLSLADLAAMNTDDVAVLTSRLPVEGIFLVRCTELGFTQSESTIDPATNQPRPPLFRLGIKTEILEAKPLKKDVDAETLVGRTLTESYVLWPAQFREAVGLLKGRYKLVDLPYTGNVGGVEGQEPGWVDGAVNHIFRVRVRHFTSKGNERAGFDWLPAEDKKAA